MKKTLLSRIAMVGLLLSGASGVFAQSGAVSGTAEAITVTPGSSTGTSVQANGEVPDGISRYKKVPDGRGGWKMVLKDGQPGGGSVETNHIINKDATGRTPDNMREIKPPHIIASSSTKPMGQKMEDRRGEIEQKRAEMKNDMQGRMANIMQKQGERVIKRLEAALERLNNIAGRIDSRIDKLGEKGVNTTKAKADLVIAKTKIDAAKVKLGAAKTAIIGIMSDTGTAATSTPGAMMSGKITLIKEQVRGVEEALKDAHKALVLVITDLKGKSVTATTTASVSN